MLQRPGLLCLLAVVAVAAVAADAPPGEDGHRFVKDAQRVCTFATDQVDVLVTAGDELTYETRLRWDFLLVPTAVAADEVTLRVTFTRVEAALTGPGVAGPAPAPPDGDPDAGTVPRTVPRVLLARFESGDPATADDPLFGHWAALVGKPLDLTVDPRTGAVSRIAGLGTVVAAVAERSALAGGEPDEATVAEARRRFDQAAFKTIWSRILQVPVIGEDTVALAPDGSHPVPRRWDGSTWTLTLPEGERPEIVIAGDPTPVTVTVTALKGRGSVDLAGGVLAETRGEIAMELGGTALTQDVTQRQTITWHCVLRDLSAP